MGVKANVFPQLSAPPHVHVWPVCVCVCRGPSSLKCIQVKSLSVLSKHARSGFLSLSFFLFFHPALRTRIRGRKKADRADKAGGGGGV